jgi:hypothetical protein
MTRQSQPVLLFAIVLLFVSAGTEPTNVGEHLLLVCVYTVDGCRVHFDLTEFRKLAGEMKVG